MFRYKPGIKVGYIRQGYIYFVSLLYRELPAGKRCAIDELCHKSGGEYWEALREFVTTETKKTEICAKYFISDSTLHRVVRKYYQSFPRYL